MRPVILGARQNVINTNPVGGQAQRGAASLTQPPVASLGVFPA